MAKKEKSLSHLTLLAIDAAIEAGAILRAGFGTQFTITEKEGRHNLVTEYDHRSEEHLIRFFQKHVPESSILAEESGGIDAPKKGLLWIIDPLDGTVNFAHQVPCFSVSIGLEIDGQITSGVVYHPLLHELFVAEKGKGAFLNGNALSVSKVPSVIRSIFATGFPYNLYQRPEDSINPLFFMLRKGIPIRRFGSAALDLSYVAAGRFDGFFESALSPWDCAAGNLIVEEAGGKVTDWEGNRHAIHGKGPILATNGKIHKESLAIIRNGDFP